MPCCKEVTLMIEKELQHAALSFWQRMGMKIHLLICIYCRRYAQQSKIIDTHLDGMVAQTDLLPDPSLKEKWEKVIAENKKK
ncbi:MAG: hypothetical protein J7623_26300 [Chitinophaga sp.]|uniref:hypothetical protein n=1 Tax=Chitinophaga sp. TaxID=1869181 RepID=UPI001B12F8DF|nr:hypothetical protein [Chitinophaga sp.]MBO9732181.1 hypothetical protein [Chitinophaga sp.]